MRQEIKEEQRQKQTEEVSQGAAPPQISPSAKAPMIIASYTEMVTVTQPKKYRNIAASISIVKYVGESPTYEIIVKEEIYNQICMIISKQCYLNCIIRIKTIIN